MYREKERRKRRKKKKALTASGRSRRVRQEFNKHQGEVAGSSQVAQLLEQGRIELGRMQRMTVVSRLYNMHDKTVVERLAVGSPSAKTLH